MSFIDGIDLVENAGIIILMHNISCAEDFGMGLSDLSQREKKRYKKIQNDVQKALYLKQRIVLKHALSKALVCDASEIKYRYRNGKPRLVSYIISDFNISHSADTFAIFIVRKGSCGIDVDFQRELKYSRKIAQRFFTPQEQSYISEHPDSNYAFFEVWSKKEAVVKMHATGMFADAKNFDIFDYDCSNMLIDNGFMSFSHTDNLESIQFISHDFASGDGGISFL